MDAYGPQRPSGNKQKRGREDDVPSHCTFKKTKIKDANCNSALNQVFVDTGGGSRAQ
jgi:hypothetical protein